MLTHQQRLYAEGRVNGLSKKDAAVAAGCPIKTASQAASRYERSEDVQAHMQRLGFMAAPPKKKKKAAPAEKKVESREPSQREFSAAEKLRERSADNSGHQFACPIEYMKHVMNADVEDPKLRLDAAKALAAFTVAKPGDKGKKEERQDAADRVATTGRFSSAPRPLKAVK